MATPPRPPAADVDAAPPAAGGGNAGGGKKKRRRNRKRKKKKKKSDVTGRRLSATFSFLPPGYGVAPATLEASVRAFDLLAALGDVARQDLPATTRWLAARTRVLVHPSLPKPLPYLEMSATVHLVLGTTAAAGEAALESLCGALEAHDERIGKAEHLLALNTPMPLLPTALPRARCGAGADVAAGAALFTKFGVLAMSEALSMARIMPVEEVGLHELRSAVLERLDSCLTAFKRQQVKYRLALARGGRAAKGVKPWTGKFREIVSRGEGRFDCELRLGGADGEPPAWERAAYGAGWVPLVAKYLGGRVPSAPGRAGAEAAECGWRVVRCGVVVSHPGTGEQEWHIDSPHEGAAISTFAPCGDGEGEAAPPHAVCVFAPLVDLSADTGFTEFWAGSHHYDRLLDDVEGQSATLPGGTDGIVGCGSCVAYDYRVIHRGRANRSDAARPIFYALYGRGQWKENKRNWGKVSVFD